MRIRLFKYLYKYFFKPIAFRFSADTMHDLATQLGRVIGRVKFLQKITHKLFYYRHDILRQEVAGIVFDNPVGLAAGFDKDAYILETLPQVGFGFSSLGTITYYSYEGNPKPWANRLIKSRALTVNYGLKNEGIEAISKRVKLAKLPAWYRFGVSIGKTNSKDTAGENEGVADYIACFKKVQALSLGDWYEINISCPNTFGGEPFATPQRLQILLGALLAEKPDKPVFVKMPINLAWPDFKQLIDVSLSYGVSGLIIGNLNKDRTDTSIKDIISENIKGGISGKPTEKLSNELISQTYAYAGDKIAIIGVGGIFSAEDAYEKIKRGASLVQLITGMIYEGPQLIGEINKGLVALLKNDDLESISEAVGTYHK